MNKKSKVLVCSVLNLSSLFLVLISLSVFVMVIASKRGGSNTHKCQKNWESSKKKLLV